MRVQHLFFSTDPERQTLHRRITPTPTQREQQQERWNDLRDYLVGDLAARTGLPISSWLQGSYKFGTQVRPCKKGGEFDIDLGIYLGWQGSPHRGAYSAEEVKALVQASIVAYAHEAEDEVLEVLEPPKERCSRIRFSGDFHIDVPSYHLDGRTDTRHLATETHSWEASDPKRFYVWFRDQFDDEDNTLVRRLVRYLKIWAALTLEQAPSSVLVTVLVADAYEALTPGECESDDFALRNVASRIAARLRQDSSVLNPVEQQENLNRLSPSETDQLIQALEGLVAIADVALRTETESEAAAQWTRVFQHFFPAPREAISGEQANALVSVAFDPQVDVEATPKAGQPVFRNTNRIGPIPKGCSIRFALSNAADLPAGARIEWVVRNEGEEAELTNDLGHLAGLGTEATENSAYRGTHFMDVGVFSAYGTVLGYRRIPVQISGMPMPARNPKRPGWTRFRGGRR